MELLVVCSANACRSPIAQVCLQGELGAEWEVVSCGTDDVAAATAGDPPLDEAVAAAATLGYDISGHRRRPVDAALVSCADLVVAMGRAHLRRVVEMEPGVWMRTYTLRELVRRASLAPSVAHAGGLAGWLDSVGTGRRPGDLLGDDPLDDIDDPAGQGLDVVQRCAEEIVALCRRLAHLVS